MSVDAPVASTPGEDRFAVARELTPELLRGLSEHFGPLLPHFALETLRSGGEVRVRPGPHGTARALYLFHPVDGEASVFTPEAELAEEYRVLRPGVGLYSDFRLVPNSLELYVYDGTTEGAGEQHRYSHPVRLANRTDHPSVASVLRTVNGTVDERWIGTAEPGVEDCLVVDGPRDIAGVGWATRVGAFGRLHSLAVRPECRRAGIGTDLFWARMEWLRRSGVRSVVTEIAVDNAGSRAIAEAGGLRTVGRIYRAGPTGRSTGSALRSGAPRS